MSCEQTNTPKGSEEEKYKKLLELRRIRGYSILAKGDTPVIVDEETFFVPSQSDSSRKYKVINFNGWSCECEDFKQRHLECKHIQSIRIFLQVRSSQDSAILELKEELNKEVVNCSFCGSDSVMKRGKRKTSTGVKQRYKCKACNRRFVPDIVNRTKVDAKMICFIMDVYYKGLSLRDIKDSVKQFFSVELHHETIRQYILKFTSKINDFTSHYTPKVSDKWHVDEQKVKTKKEKQWLWAWNILDSKTRFLIANNVTPERSISEARLVFKKAKAVTQKNNRLEIVTDGLQAYSNAISHEFTTSRARPQYRVIHSRNAGIRKARQNNNPVERYHNQFREFDKVRRGFDRVAEWNEGFRLFHNFVRENSKLGMTPAQAANINLTENNKWLSLLQKSCKNTENPLKDI